MACPRCGDRFDIDQADYAALLSQVRGAEFEKEVESAVAARMKAAEAEHGAELARAVARERDAAGSRLAGLERELAGARLDAEKARGEAAAARSREDGLRASMVAEAETAKLALRHELEAGFAAERAELEAQVAYYRDLKARMSTKMVGESLEEHCRQAFDRIRAAAFPDAYFEKDNEVSGSGSKGDFIFRESRDGVELVSIMFEMKNESDAGAARKHRNEEFFKELDKDRREKGCEYAVLVSLLEPDSDLYNDGIVDVSHRYPKMYVVRPQFFIPMITVLRNAALNGLAVRKELAEAKSRNLDLAVLEARLEDARTAAGRNNELASKQYQDAADALDKAIAQLQKAKEALAKSERNMRIMGDKIGRLSLDRLLTDLPSLADLTP